MGDGTNDEETGRPYRRRREDVWVRYEKRVRDAIIFLVGIGGCINELFIVDEPRPSALVFLASLVGVPFILQADERKAKRD